MRMTVLLLFASAYSLPAVADNLLANPGFEELADGRPAGWSVGHTWYEEPEGSGLSAVEADSAVFQGAGQRSLRITGRQNRGLARQDLAYLPEWGGRMRLSGWMRLHETGTACGRIGVEFIGEDGKWLGQAGVATDWRKSSADWERFEREFDVPDGTRRLVFNLSTDKANEGMVWFDNVALERLEAPEPEGEPALDPDRVPEDLLPVDTFETEGIAWTANAWGDAIRPTFELRRDGAAVGDGYLRIDCPSAQANMVDRVWNHEGDFDALTFRVRRVSGGGGLTLYLVCGQVYFHAAWCAPGPEWSTVTVLREKVRYAWGARSEEEQVFDPTQVTKLSFGHDEVICFDLDHVAVDVRDRLHLGFAHTDAPGNIISPGDRPVVRVEVINAFSTPQEGELELAVADWTGRVIHRETQPVSCAGRSRSEYRLEVPVLAQGYWTAGVTLMSEGKIAGRRAVGLCALPDPTPGPKPFMGASGFGMGADRASLGHRMGVQAGEFFISWADCEPAPGDRRLEGFPATLDAYEQFGILPTGMIRIHSDAVPLWASPGATAQERSGHLTNKPEAFSDFIEAMVARYRDRVHHWSFCCEVDLAYHQWERGLDEYVEMVRAGAEGARRADPECIIGGIGVSGVDCTANPRFPIARRLWEQLHPYLDSFSLDAYASPRYFAPDLRVVGPEENDLAGMLREALEIVRQYGADKRIAIEEKGWAIDDRLPVDDVHARRMAEVLARSFIIARSVDELDYYMWFQLATRWAEGGYSYSLFRYEGDYMNPRPGAAAYAFVAQFLAGAKQPRKVALHQDLWAYVFSHSEGSRAALWTSLAEPVTLTVDLPTGLRVTDMMGMPVVAQGSLRLSSAPLYLWAEATSAEQLAAALGRASFHLPAAKLALKIPDLQRVTLHVRNQLGTELGGRLSVSPPAGWELPEPTIAVNLNAGATTAVDIPVSRIPEPLPSSPGRFVLRLATEEHGQVETTVEPTLMEVRRLQAPPTVDGDLAEYVAIEPIALADQKHLWPPDAPSAGLWTGIDDLSAKVWVAWSDLGFHFAAEVRDDRFVQERTGVSIWANDSFQIGFDPLNDGLPGEFETTTGYGPDDLEFGIALTPEGPQTFQWTGAPGGQGRLVDLPLAVVREGDTTRYEWTLPWAQAGGLSPTPGRAFGFNFVLLDADKPGETARYWLGLTPGICGGKDPSQFRTFVLMP